MNWVPGDGMCTWGAVSGTPCDEPTTGIVWKQDVIDSDPLPQAGIVAVGVCAEHGNLSDDWDRIHAHQEWVELQERWYGKVWLVQALSPVR